MATSPPFCWLRHNDGWTEKRMWPSLCKSKDILLPLFNTTMPQFYAQKISATTEILNIIDKFWFHPPFLCFLLFLKQMWTLLYSLWHSMNWWIKVQSPPLFERKCSSRERNTSVYIFLSFSNWCNKKFERHINNIFQCIQDELLNQIWVNMQADKTWNWNDVWVILGNRLLFKTDQKKEVLQLHFQKKHVFNLYSSVFLLALKGYFKSFSLIFT